MMIQATHPICIRRATGNLHLRPGQPVELADADAIRLLALTSKVRPVLHPGDIVEWLSQALPKQRGEVLEVYDDGTFEVWHPLAETLCRLPVTWVRQVLRDPIVATDGQSCQGGTLA